MQRYITYTSTGEHISVTGDCPAKHNKHGAQKPQRFLAPHLLRLAIVNCVSAIPSDQSWVIDASIDNSICFLVTTTAFPTVTFATFYYIIYVKGMSFTNEFLYCLKDSFHVVNCDVSL